MVQAFPYLRNHVHQSAAHTSDSAYNISNV